MIKTGISLDENEISEREKILLTSGAVKCIFPCNISEGEFSNVMLFFDTEGFVPISYLSDISLKNTIKLIGMALGLVEEMKDFFIYSEEYRIDRETVFVKKDFSDMKIIYSKGGEKDEMRSILDMFKDMNNRKGDEILMRIKNAFSEEKKTMRERAIFLDGLLDEIDLISKEKA